MGTASNGEPFWKSHIKTKSPSSAYWQKQYFDYLDGPKQHYKHLDDHHHQNYLHNDDDHHYDVDHHYGDDHLYDDDHCNDVDHHYDDNQS